MKYTYFAVLIVVTLTLTGWAESDELSDLKERLAIVEQRLDRLETYRTVDKYVCTDEFEDAIAFATRDVNAAAVPDLWDGTPFVVDISSAFPNAGDLLDVVADEAERIHRVLGYEIFVAGDVLHLSDIEKSDLRSPSRHQWIPPGQHIHIRCCYGAGSSSAGTSFAWLRVVLLENDSFQSRHIIIHELYHILGFTHPGDPPGVVMSNWLMYGPGYTALGASIPTQPSSRDLAKLGCIYNGY